MKKFISVICVFALSFSISSTSAFASTDVTYGDANKDTEVNISDATTIQQYVAQMIELVYSQKVRADVDGNGIIDIKDSTFVQLYSAYVIENFPIQVMVKPTEAVISVETEDGYVNKVIQP